ncbi:hypothetical protein ACIGHB_32730 [Streptomyces sp. NPDC085460]|uniref:hypothetical protein n=1 Tax=Streptomyces sp. NPDC085460 TaxID=3365723 RepID=UPI0037D6996E
MSRLGGLSSNSTKYGFIKPLDEGPISLAGGRLVIGDAMGVTCFVSLISEAGRQAADLCRGHQVRTTVCRGWWRVVPGARLAASPDRNTDGRAHCFPMSVGCFGRLAGMLRGHGEFVFPAASESA